MDFENTLNATGIMTAVDLFFGSIILTLTIVNLLILRSCQHLHKTTLRAVDRIESKLITIKDNQATIINKTANTSRRKYH